MFFLALIMFGPAIQSRAVVKDEGSPHGDSRISTPAAPAMGHGTAAYWRSSLWDAIPGDWLRDPKQAAVLEHYQRNDWQPFFIAPDFELKSGAKVFIQKLEKLENEAIDPRPYQLTSVQQGIMNLDKTRIAFQEISPGSKEALGQQKPVPSSGSQAPTARKAPQHVQYAMDTSSQHVPPPDDSARNKEKEQRLLDAIRAGSELDVKLTQNLIRLAREMNPRPEEMLRKGLSGEVPMAQFLKEIEPSSPSYEPLHRSFERYRKLTTQGGQVWFNEKGHFRPGESGNHVRALQKRLQQEAFYSGTITGSFDEETQKAIRRFQRSHMLESSGAIDQRTRELLNMPFSQKERMISLSLKGLRRNDTRSYERYVRINVPQYKLEYYKDGKVQEVHRVIVGKASGKKIKYQGRIIGENQTPILTSNIENIIFNPRWYISDRIRQEMSGRFDADPAYFAKHGYVQMSSMYPQGGPRLFQLPGPTNPLGRVKFEFPNAYAVFVHDTPNKKLFSRERRDFSHGCIRLEGAMKLAQTILKDEQNPAADKTESFLKGTNQVYVKLQKPVPILIEYLPAIADENGQIVFCGDPYGLSKEPNTNG